MEKTRILVVDDEADIRENLREILDMEGYDVTTAGDGLEALRLISAASFDVALMDIRMPGIDGVETFRRLKEKSPGTPVIMITAYSMEDRIQASLREGAYGVMRKPIDFKRLFENIELARSREPLILVVDDDETFSENIRETLAADGFNTQVASDGDADMEMMRRNDFDIVVLDMKMPRMNGLDAIRELREIRPGANVVLVSGFDAEMRDHIDEALTHVPCVYMRKPFDSAEFVQRLRDIILQRQSAVQNG